LTLRNFIGKIEAERDEIVRQARAIRDNPSKDRHLDATTLKELRRKIRKLNTVLNSAQRPSVKPPPRVKQQKGRPWSP